MEHFPRGGRLMKRAVDIVLAMVGLLVLAPVMALIALLIKLDSRGPIFFRQERIGRDFRPFRIIKFRSMVTNSQHAGPLLTCGEDPRITRLGRLLRRTKLDEFPQLVNVLIGDMSLVGPRPEVGKYVAMFESDFRTILRIRPGITDLASIEYRNEAAILGAVADPEQEYTQRILPSKIQLAKEYARRSSLYFDIVIILRTLASLVRGTV
jgi:lipopolysaccharide/colanic/teichoic acid biosynthesis glycosyltransferase